MYVSKLALLFCASLTALTSTSSAGWFGRGRDNQEAPANYLYEQEFRNMGKGYTALLEDLPNDNIAKLPSDQQQMCRQRYDGILNDGVIDIRVALGYFDWTTGSTVYNYGYSPSMDLGGYAALKDLITSRCSGNLRICGFKQQSPNNPYVFTRNVTLFGKQYPVRLEVQFSSATEYFESNTGKYANQQQQRTAFMDKYFADALQNADATFYFGHSRNGGGPDFAPPRLTKARKVNYDGYYEVVRPGLQKMMAALNSQKQTKIFGLMSCDSRDHFWRKLRTAAPHTGVITSTAVLNVNEVYTAMIGAVDAILRGQCQKTFYRELRMTERNQQFITMDGMFE